MIVLFTDFGWNGPYVGQVKAVLSEQAPGVPVIDLMHDAPVQNPRAAAYLLASLTDRFPRDAIFCAVVDPGVGGERRPVLVDADGQRFVGPGNGLFEIVWRRAKLATMTILAHSTTPRSATFHGRDIFAPVAARLACGEPVATEALTETLPGRDWPDDLAEIVYVDSFGNAMTGIWAQSVSPTTGLRVNDHRLVRRRTFPDVAPGEPFCFENSNGLLEVAVNQGRADDVLGLKIGTPVAPDLT